MRSMYLTVAAAAAVAAFALAGCGGHPRATVATCTAEIVAHPDESTEGPGCRGLTHDQLVQATVAAMAQGAIG